MADIINFADYCNKDAVEFDFTIPNRPNYYAASVEKNAHKPERQGSLDGLCAIYSIINAVNYVVKPSQKQRNKLFKHLVKTLDTQWRVSRFMLNGTSRKTFCYLLLVTKKWLKRSCGIKLKIVKIFNSHIRVTKERYLRQLKIFLSIDKSVIIAGLKGIHWHWTCFTAVTPKTIKLLDSDGLSRLRTSTCIISKKSKAKYHCLHPSITWGVQIDDK